jgi:hypothetical protein
MQPMYNRALQVAMGDHHSMTNYSPYITVVSGLPRSGTSMMMKMLEAGGLPPLADHLRAADEDNPKGYYEFERAKKLRDGDVAWLPQAQGKVVKAIAALLLHLPSDYTYRVIFMRRAMPEVLASQKQMLVRRREDPHKVGDDEMTRLFEKHLTQVDAWIKSQPNITRLDVDYNQMLIDPVPQVMAINQFLGGTLDVDKMIEVVDPALYRQRQQSGK